jgi:hypothetical protein
MRDRALFNMRSAASYQGTKPLSRPESPPPVAVRISEVAGVVHQRLGKLVLNLRLGQASALCDFAVAEFVESHCEEDSTLHSGHPAERILDLREISGVCCIFIVFH